MSVTTEDKTAVKPEGEEQDPNAPETSAPSKTKEEPGGRVDTTDDSQPDEGNPRGESWKTTITELRRDRRSLREENSTLKKQIEQLMVRAPGSQPPEKPSDDGGDKNAPGFFEDPDSHLEKREQKFKESLMGDLVLLSEKAQAVKLIRSQEGFTETDEDPFADLMEENGLDILSKTHPIKAAKLAIDLWRREKGLSGKPPAQKAQAGSVRGGAPAGGEKKITRSYLRELQRRISKGEKGETIDKELREAWAAANAGRIIED